MKKTIHDRVREYEREGMYIFDAKGKLMHCKFCNQRVTWDWKSSIDSHVESSSHVKAKKTALQEGASGSGAIKRQASIGDAIDHAKKVKEDKEEFIKTTVHAFMKANIPLHKLDDEPIRSWMVKYVKGAGDLPTSRWLREHYVPLIKTDYDDVMKQEIKGKKIVVLCDETMNRRGQAVFLVLFKVLSSEEKAEPQLLVASVTILEACNSEQCSKAILQALNHFEVEYDNVMGVASDSAAYMNKCIRLLKELVNKNLVHIHATHTARRSSRASSRYNRAYRTK